MQNTRQPMRSVLVAYGGRMTLGELKAEVAGPILEPKRWNTWSRKVRTLAAQDPFVAIDGNGSRLTFSLREKPVDLVSEVVRALRFEDRFVGKVKVIREFLTNAPSKEVGENLYQLLQETVEKLFDVAKENDPVGLMEALLFLEGRGNRGYRFHRPPRAGGARSGRRRGVRPGPQLVDATRCRDTRHGLFGHQRA